MMVRWRQISHGCFLSGAIALLPAYRTAPDQQVTVQPLAQARQTLVGTVIGTGETDENEWLVATSNRVVVVDAGPRWYQNIALEMNETVSIIGEFDAGEFDAFTITRADGTVVTVRPAQGPPPWAGGPHRQVQPQSSASEAAIAIGSQTISGPIVGTGEADENEWLVQTRHGIVIVDAGDRNYQSIDLPIGEIITVTGEFDDGEFDAFTITRTDGSVIQVFEEQD